VQFGETSGDRQAEPQSTFLWLTRGAGLLEWQKDSGQRLAGQADAGVPHLDGDTVGGWVKKSLPRCVLRERRFPRVAQDIPEDLENPVAIRRDPAFHRV